MLRGTVLVVVVGLGAGAGLRAEEPVAIKLKQLDQGESCWVDQRSEVEFLMQLTADSRVTEKQEQKSSLRFTFRETVLAKQPKDRRPTRLEREYEKAEVAAQGKTHAFPYQGWTVLVEKENDHYQFRIKGGDKLSEQDAPYLYREFDDSGPGRIEEQMFLPKRPVAVNESWKIDAAPLVESFEKSSPFRVEAAKVTAAGKLLKIYRRDERRYGVLSVRVDLPLTTYTLAENKVTLKDGSRAVIDATVDVCIDGSSVDGKMDIATEVSASSTRTGPDGKDYLMTVTIRNRGKELRADLARR